MISISIPHFLLLQSVSRIRPKQPNSSPTSSWPRRCDVCFVSGPYRGGGSMNLPCSLDTKCCDISKTQKKIHVLNVKRLLPTTEVHQFNLSFMEVKQIPTQKDFHVTSRSTFCRMLWISWFPPMPAWPSTPLWHLGQLLDLYKMGIRFTNGCLFYHIFCSWATLGKLLAVQVPMPRCRRPGAQGHVLWGPHG